MPACRMRAASCGDEVPGTVLAEMRIPVTGNVSVTSVLAVMLDALAESNHVMDVAPKFPCRSSSVY